MRVPKAIQHLAGKFDEHIEACSSGRYNEAQPPS